MATTALRDLGYNGGRWRVHGLEFDDYDAAVEAFDFNESGDFDSFEEWLPPLPRTQRPTLELSRASNVPSSPFRRDDEL